MNRKVTEPMVSFSVDVSDSDARKLAALRYRVPVARIEIERNGGCVLARVKHATDVPLAEQGRLL